MTGFVSIKDIETKRCVLHIQGPSKAYVRGLLRCKRQEHGAAPWIFKLHNRPIAFCSNYYSLELI